MPATIFSGNNVKALKSNLDLNGVTKILSVNADPASGAGVAAPLGSIAMDYLAGKVYKKTGSLDTEWQELGSGIGGINYIENPDAESGTAGWSTYADAAGSAPVDGTGGTANITWSRSTTTPLRGVADFNLVKDAVNRQGQGVSYDFTIDSADQAKILTISADYEVISGTFATGDLAVYIIQDPAGTPVVLQPAGYQVTAGTNGNKLRLAATFQTASNVTSYRLCIHVASVSALAYTLAFDSIAVSPQQVVYGAPVTDWQDYTPVITAVTTNPTLGTTTVNKARWRRVGDSMQIEYQVKQTSAGTAGSGLYFFALPSGYAVDSSKLGYFSAHDGVAGAGNVTVQTASTTGTGSVYAYDATRLACLFVADTVGAGGVTWGSANFAFSNAALTVSFTAQVPILGWSSSVVVSSSTDTRVVAARIFKTTNQGPFSVETKLTGYTVDRDSHGMWDSTNNRFNIPVSGDYQLFIQTNAVLPSGTASQVPGYKINGGSTVYIGTDSNAATTVRFGGAAIVPNLKAGDYVEIYHYTNANVTVQAGTTGTFASLTRISGPSQIAASETVAARYEATGNRTPTTAKAINYDTKVFDTHGAVTTVSGDVAGWKFTAPVSGKYSVSLSNYMSAAAVSTLQLCKNGSLYAWMASNNIANVAQHSTAIVDVIAGDTIDIRADGTPTCVNVTAKILSVSIHRIGN